DIQRTRNVRCVPALRVERHEHEPAAPAENERGEKDPVPLRLAPLDQRSESGCEQGGIAAEQPGTEGDRTDREDSQKRPSLPPVPIARRPEEQQPHEPEPGGRLHDEASNQVPRAHVPSAGHTAMAGRRGRPRRLCVPDHPWPPITSGLYMSFRWLAPS